MLDAEELIPRAIAAAIFLLVGFPVHEYAHARTALHFGDATAKLFGRVTLDPRAHLDPVGSMVLVLTTLTAGIPIGWAKPTPVNPAMMRGGRRSHGYVALAGPLSNIAMAVPAAVAIRLMLELEFVTSQATLYVAQTVITFLVINVALFVFNLIPAPPLDGATVLVNLLPSRWAWRVGPLVNQWGRWLLMILIGLAVLPAIFPQAASLPNPIGDLIYGIVNLLVGV